MRRFLMVTAAVLALAGCNKGADQAKGAVAANPAGVNPANLPAPTRKEGLWTYARTRDGQPAGGRMAGMKICVDATSSADAGIFGRGLLRGRCSEARSTKNADGSYTFESTCEAGDAGVIKTKGTASGDFSSKYTVHTDIDMEGADDPNRNGHHTMDMTATYAGACPSGMHGGDVQLPTGQVVTRQEMQAMFRQARQAGGGGGGGQEGGNGGGGDQQ